MLFKLTNTEIETNTRKGRVPNAVACAIWHQQFNNRRVVNCLIFVLNENCVIYQDKKVTHMHYSCCHIVTTILYTGFVFFSLTILGALRHIQV